jgi:aspartokinase-like uncharacterized kinase
MTRPVVLKIGGSLLDWTGLPARLSEACAARGDPPLIVLVGGGRVADVVRDLDRVHGLGPEPAHHLALRALDLTAQVLAALLPPGLDVVDHPEQCAAVWERSRVPVLAPRRFLDDIERRGADPLPHTWDVTTDSIAARVAVHLGASELALWKSAPLPPGADLDAAARLGLVDPAFPAEARRLRRVTYRNLRDPLNAAIILS